MTCEVRGKEINSQCAEFWYAPFTLNITNYTDFVEAGVSFGS